VEVQMPAPTVRGAKAAPPLPHGNGWEIFLHELARQLDRL
jgi:hypothetical protein